MWPTLVTLCLALSGKARQRSAPRRPAFRCPSFRLCLEALEDRLTPSLIISADTGVFPQVNLVAPAGSVYFGAQIVTLSNGNFVATDASGNGGAAYLINGQTGAIISALTGLGDGPTVTALTNGNYVVDSPSWHGGFGAVTWGSGTTGASGTPSAANSLVGTTPFDYVGGLGGTGGGVTALPNGNYVVDSPSWGSIGATLGRGAVTWGNGSTGTSGVVSAANSLVGAAVSDNVGVTAGIGSAVTILANGNYVVNSVYWGNGVGAVTWGNGATGTLGLVSSDNSLVGSITGSGGAGDNVGWSGVTALTNGNYVVDSSRWNGQEGAVTWGNGATGTTGVVSPANSLVGSNSSSSPSGADLVGSDGVTALANGNYVVDSSRWSLDANSGYLLGAVTWGNGATGSTGPVSLANSLVGSNLDDLVGGSNDAAHSGVTALANGNYVVDSPAWGSTLSINAGMGAEFLGAVTWENGTAPAVGTVSASNSLVGTIPTQFGTSNRVGHGGVIALTNGNYVVDSPDWNISVPFNYQALGAVTWGNGTTGISGTVSAANSLVGSFLGDAIGGGQPATDGEGSGHGGVTALANGNYVVDSPGWLKQTGAVTWGDGTTGIRGTVSADNSLVGDAAGDQVGGPDNSDGLGVEPLTNGNYVVFSPGKGTATLGNGATGITGTLSAAQSLGGVAGAVFGATALPNGNYVVFANNGQGDASDTWVDGTTGATLDGQNTIDAQNSLLGVAGALPLFGGSAFVAARAFTGQITIGITDPNLLTYALGQSNTISITPDFLTRSLDAGTAVNVQSNDDIVVNSPITVNPTGTPASLSLQAGRSVLINASISTTGGNLSLIANDTRADGVIDSARDPGNAAITMGSGQTVNTGAGTLRVDLKITSDKTNNGQGTATLLGLTSARALLSSATAFGVDLNGTTPGDGSAGTFTQTAVAGPIDLGGATLALTSQGSFAMGQQFVIVKSTQPIVGTFAGLAEGSTIAAAGQTFRISYLNDQVTLTNLTPGGGFSYDSSTLTLTISANAPVNTFTFSQATTEDASNVLHTTYTFELNGVTQTYTNSQVVNVIVNGAAASANSATLITRDAYTGTDGLTHELSEFVTLGPGGGSIYKTNASGSQALFLELNNFQISYAYVSRADTAQLTGVKGAGIENVFVTAGGYSYVFGTGQFHLISGAASVYGYAANSTDQAWQYDAAGSLDSFVASGTAYSYMSGSDTSGDSFFNVAVGFQVNYGISTHGNAIAYLIDSPNNDVFYGTTTYSYMSGSGYFNVAEAFALVYSESFVGGTDYAYNHDVSHNILNSRWILLT